MNKKRQDVIRIITLLLLIGNDTSLLKKSPFIVKEDYLPLHNINPANNTQILVLLIFPFLLFSKKPRFLSNNPFPTPKASQQIKM